MVEKLRLLFPPGPLPLNVRLSGFLDPLRPVFILALFVRFSLSQFVCYPFFFLTKCLCNRLLVMLPGSRSVLKTFLNVANRDTMNRAEVIPYSTCQRGMFVLHNIFPSDCTI